MNLLKDPLSWFSSAASSTIGGVMTIFAATAFGTLIATWFEHGSVPDWDDLPFLLLIALGTVGMACFQIWGLIYLAVLAVLFHRTIIGEASRLRIFLLVTALQTIVTSLVVCINETVCIDAGVIFRVALVSAIYAIIGFVLWRVHQQAK